MKYIFCVRKNNVLSLLAAVIHQGHDRAEQKELKAAERDATFRFIQFYLLIMLTLVLLSCLLDFVA
jgi:hypothetical protein